MEVIERVSCYLRNQCQISADDSVLIAVSGGPDSVALMSILAVISKEMSLRLMVGHVNHCLRGTESDEDAEFVVRAAAEQGLQCMVERVDITSVDRGGQSLQMAARELRLRALKSMASVAGVSRIALGHTRDDQAETILFRIITGTSLTGLAGIRPMGDEAFIHPLLEVTRQEIEQFLTQRGLSARQDPTNKKLDYRRNRIRNQLIPEIEQHMNPNLKDALVRLSELAVRDDDYIQRQVDQLWDQAVSVNSMPRYVVIDRQLCGEHHEAVVTRLVVRAMFATGSKRTDESQIRSMYTMINTGEPRTIWLPGKIMAEIVGSSVIMTWQAMERASWDVQVPGDTIISELGISITTELVDGTIQRFPSARSLECYVDADKVGLLAVRFRQPGDRFHPLGSSGSKKLKDHFIDEKMPRGVRNLTPLVVDGDNIIWVVGSRIDHRYRITDETTRVLRITVQPHG